jgi:dTDP-4-dehydrorhamnose reductase
MHGHNFIKTILKLIQKKDALNIVNDQKGTPTSATLLADVTSKIIKKMMVGIDFKDFGTYHLTSQGDTNWHHYAISIYHEAIRLGMHPTIDANDIKTISSIDYITPAKRPLNSILNTEKIKKTFMVELPHWEDEVKKVLRALIH